MDWIAGYADSLSAKSRRITAFLEQRMGRVCIAWLAVACSLALWRLSAPASPIRELADAAPILLAYAAVIAAPVAGYLIGRHAFVGKAAVLQPRFRFARYGRWTRLTDAQARALPSFGAVGLMASLLVGMLLNVALRTFEFFAAVPAMSARAPGWGQALFAFMAFDVVVTSFFYMVAFVMALRTIPLFPRMLLYAWLIDLTMQLLILRQVAASGIVPDAILPPLLDLLQGNMTKVGISALIWLPYLLLSERVNITYRHRTADGLAEA